MLATWDVAAADVYRRDDLRPTPLALPVWDVLLTAGIALFLLDVAARRIALTWTDARRLAHAAADQVRGFTLTTRAVEDAGTLAALRVARDEMKTPADERRWTAQQRTSLAAMNGRWCAAHPMDLAAARSTAGESGTRSNVYFQFTVSSNAGTELDLTSLTFNVAQGGGTAGTRDYEVRSSLDGYVTSLTSIVPIPTVRPTFTPVSVDLSGAVFQNLSSLTFQVRFFTPGVSQNVDFDDIALNGTVASLVPEPNALALLMTAVTWTLKRRRSIV